MDNAAELMAEVRLGYVGIGWQINNIPSHFSHLETYELLEAKNLKALRPGTSKNFGSVCLPLFLFWHIDMCASLRVRSDRRGGT